MNRRTFLRNSVLLAAGTLISGSVSNDNTLVDENTSPQDDTKEKYAIISCPVSYRDKSVLSYSFDEGVKNAFLISAANAYDSLRKMGYSAENIRVLFHDGNIDTSETIEEDKIQRLASEQFEGGNGAPATLDNLVDAMDSFSALPEESEFTMVLLGHGIRDGVHSYLRYPDDNGEEHRVDARDLLGLVSPIKSGKQLYVLDFCYSGEFGEKIGEENRVAVASCSHNSPGIISRVDGFSRFFFDAAVDLSSDANEDGVVSVSEAFTAAEKRREPVLKEHYDAGHFQIFNPDGFTGHTFNLGSDFPIFKYQGGQN